MPELPRFQASAPPAVHSQVVYPPQQQGGGFWADIGNAFNLAKGIQGMFREDPNERQVRDNAIDMWSKRYDSADSPEAKSDIAKQALAYADKVGNEELRAIFMATNPKDAMSQKHRAGVKVTEYAQKMDETGQSGGYAEGGGVPAPPTPTAPVQTPSFPQPQGTATPVQQPMSPAQQIGQQVGETAGAVSGFTPTKQEVTPSGPPPVSSEIQGGPWNPPPSETVQKDQGVESPQYHPVQMQIAVTTGIDPDEVRFGKPSPQFPDGYPYVGISNLATNPDLPFDAFFEPPPPGPEDSAIMQTYTKNVTRAQQLARDMTSLRIWSKVYTGQVPDAADALGFALNAHQAQMLIKEQAAAAGAANLEFMDVMTMAQLFAKEPGSIDYGSSDMKLLQERWAGMSTSEQKGLISAAKLWGDSIQNGDQIRAQAKLWQEQTRQNSIQLAQNQQRINMDYTDKEFDRTIRATLLPHMVNEYLSNAALRRAQIGEIGATDQRERDKLDWQKRWAIFEADQTRKAQLVQLIGLWPNADDGIKAAQGQATMLGSNIAHRDTEIQRYMGIKAKATSDLDAFRGRLESDLAPGERTTRDQAMLTIQQADQEITKLSKLNEIDQADRDRYIQEISESFKTYRDPDGKPLPGSKQSMILSILEDYKNPITPASIPGGASTTTTTSKAVIPDAAVTWAAGLSPGLSASLFAEVLAAEGIPGMTQDTARALYAKYQAGTLKPGKKWTSKKGKK